MDRCQCAFCCSYIIDKSPRILQCRHSFCVKCLIELINSKTIHCPICWEITELKSKDVAELNVRFLLHQMNEEVKVPTAPPIEMLEEQKNKPLCQICKIQDPLFYCTTCQQRICQPCKEKHNRFTMYQSHAVSKLCEIHQDRVTHLCLKCIRPLCMQCLFMDHSQLTSYSVPYNEGLKQLQKNAESLLKMILTVAEEEMKENQKTKTIITDIIHKLEERKVQYEAKSKEIREVSNEANPEEIREGSDEAKLKETKKEIEEVKKSQTQFLILQSSFTATKNCAVTYLKTLIISTDGICEKYKKLMDKARESLDNMKKIATTMYFLHWKYRHMRANGLKRFTVNVPPHS